jgi:hypothetical protein
MLTLTELLEIEDNFHPVATIKVRKFREHKTRKFHSVPKQSCVTYRTVSNDLLA